MLECPQKDRTEGLHRDRTGGDTISTSDQCPWLCGSSAALRAKRNISVNALELLAKLVSGNMSVVACGDRTFQSMDGVLLRGDAASALQWISRCRGGQDTCSCVLMRMLSVVDLTSGRFFDAMPVPGMIYSVADEKLRWARDDVHINLRAIRPGILWQACPLWSGGTRDVNLHASL